MALQLLNWRIWFAVCSFASSLGAMAWAADTGHWAFAPPERPQVAADEHAHPIDVMIGERLAAHRMTFSPPADRRTLLRRLSFDLTGLPPTSAETDHFLNNTADDAYEQLVDRLLASPHFGERMAMYWLDVVRYADTNGIHGDNPRPHSSYRDWVIRAFNDNLPYDQFVIKQLAGDLVPGATFADRIASGFNRLNMTTREGGAQPKEYQAIYQADRVRNTASIFLGVTLGCAQCHDHKFDPFSIRDFYRFAAFFADVEETAVGEQQPVVLPRIRHDARAEALDRRIEELQRQLTTTTPELEAAQAEWEKSLAAPTDPWQLLIPHTAQTTGGRLAVEPQGIIRQADDSKPLDADYTIEVRSDLSRITALYLEALGDPDLPMGGPGLGSNGNFVLTDLQLEVDGKPIKLAAASAVHSQQGYEVTGAIDDQPKSGWAILPNVGQSAHAVFELEQPIEEAQGKHLRLVMTHGFGMHHMIGKFRWWGTDQPRPVTAEGSLAQRDIVRIVQVDPARRTEAQSNTLAAHYRSLAPLLEPAREELARLKVQQEEIGGPLPILVTKAVKPRTVRVLPRGNWLDDTGEVVEPAVPQSLGALSDVERRATRLDLAHWLVAPQGPLVARVYVNRLWKIAFGQGLVRTLDDFGTQGAPPSHPELLDWLATELVASGWDTKHLLKRMVMSATYRQSSVASEAARRSDPLNQWYARQNRFRLDAEMVRDNALAISGLLEPSIGGPSVYPYQPAGYWAHLNFPEREWQHDTGPNQYRRSLYTFWCRTFLHPAMLALDAPSREECTVARPRSNTPTAALVLLNDPTFVEAARVFAARILDEGGTTIAERLQFTFREALGRDPRPEETAHLTQLFARHLADYASEPAAARQLQKVGLSPGYRDERNLAEHAAWTSVARVVLNMHEVITRQ
jgi:hypothetical protein